MWLNKKILVPTDFSEPSKAAADVASELATRFGVPLVVVHSHLAPLGAYTPVPVAPRTDYVQALEDTAHELLEEEARRLRGRNVEVTTLLRFGFASQEILAVVQELDVGLIVMGTHGRRGLPRALLGSVAEKIVRLSPVPVLTVHAGSSQTQAAVTARSEDTESDATATNTNRRRAEGRAE